MLKKGSPLWNSNSLTVHHHTHFGLSYGNDSYNIGCASLKYKGIHVIPVQKHCWILVPRSPVCIFPLLFYKHCERTRFLSDIHAGFKNTFRMNGGLCWGWLTTNSYGNQDAIMMRVSKQYLTHWGRVTHVYVSKLTIIGSDNGLSPQRRQAIIWSNAGILLIGTLGTNFSEILSEIHTFLFKKMHFKTSSANWWPFCLGLNVLTLYGLFENMKICKLGNRQLKWWLRYKNIT